MATAETVLISVTSILSLAILAFLWPAYRNREKRGVVWFMVFVAGIACYSLSTVLTLVITSSVWSFVIRNINVLGTSCIAVSWLLFALAYTDIVSPSRRVTVALLAYPVVVQVFAWTNPLHLLMYPPLSEFGESPIRPLQPGFLLYTLLSYALAAVATGFVMYDAGSSSGIRRRQGFALIAALVPPLLGNLPFTLGYISLNLTPLGFIITAGILGWALFYADFLDIVPAGRRQVYEQMDDPAVTVDADGNVVDCNPAARSLTGVDSDWVGMEAAEFLQPLPDELRDTLSNGGAVTGIELSVPVDGTERHFIVNSQPVGEEIRSARGRFVLFRDITQQKRRENELDLMRQVQSRVLRHNIRNRLSVVMSNAESLAAELDGEHEHRAEQVLGATGDLLSTSRKARAVERLVDGEREPRQIDVVAALERAVMTNRRRFPEVEFETDLPDEARVRTVPSIQVAFENLIENGAEHNEGPKQVVEVRADRENGDLLVSIRDNGPGIPEYELSVREQGGESELDHGSGIGLWVVDWVIERSEATLSYRVSADGTTVTIRIPDG